MKSEPKKRGRPRGTADLTTLSGVLREHIATHRLMKAGKMDVAIACKLIWSLSLLKEIIVVATIEPKLLELEELHQINDATRSVVPLARQLHS
jgi:hypothetical protein